MFLISKISEFDPLVGGGGLHVKKMTEIKKCPNYPGGVGQAFLGPNFLAFFSNAPPPPPSGRSVCVVRIIYYNVHVRVTNKIR